MSDDQLRQLFSAAGLDWLFTDGAPARLAQIRQEMHEVELDYRQRFARDLDLFALCAQDVAQKRALPETFAASMSVHIRTKVVRIFEGAWIDSISLEYRYRQHCRIAVQLLMPHEELHGNDRFVTENFWDAEVLRHLGMMTADGLPVFYGYFAFRRA